MNYPAADVPARGFKGEELGCFILFSALLIIASMMRWDIAVQLAVFDSDLGRYSRGYSEAATTSFLSNLTESGREPVFAIATWLLSKMQVPFALVVEGHRLLWVVGFYAFSRAITGRARWALFSTALLVMSPFFFSVTGVVLRQGLAMLLVFAALGCLGKGWTFRAAILTLVAAATHWSSILAALYILLAHIPLKGIWRAWVAVAIASAVLYAAGISTWVSSYAFDQLTNSADRFNRYVTDSEASFNWNYMIVAIVSILSATATLRSSSRRIARLTATVVLIATSSYLLLAGMPFIDRVALLPWLMTMPLIGLQASRLRLTPRRPEEARWMPS